MFPGLRNYYFPGSASANYFHGIYGVNAGSHLDNLHQLDRITSAAFPNCIVVTGCYTFFAPQGSADPTWTNAGNANYHAMIVTVRHSLSKGLAFDFNYTWSHAIDNGSGTASGSGQFGGILQNVFVPSLNRGDSSFDFRHAFNANFVYQLPVGKGKQFLNTAPHWLDEIAGGWQVSGLVRVQSGRQVNVAGDGVFNANYWNSSGAYPINGVRAQRRLDRRSEWNSQSLFFYYCQQFVYRRSARRPLTAEYLPFALEQERRPDGSEGFPSSLGRSHACRFAATHSTPSTL